MEKTRRNPISRGLAILLCAVLLCSLIPVGASTAKAAEEGGRGYDLTVINFTPNNTTVKASVWGNNITNWESIQSGSYTYKQSQRQTATTLDYVDIGFSGVTAGYVPVAIWASAASVQDITSAINSGKTFKEAYVDYCRRLTTAQVSDYGPTSAQWEMGGNHEVENNYDYSFLFTGTDNEGEPLSIYRNMKLITGAIPADENAVSFSVSTPAAMKIGGNNQYESDWAITATAINNASYPIYVMTSIDGGGVLLSTNPTNIQNQNELFYLTTKEMGFETRFLAPGEVMKTTGVFSTAVRLDNGRTYYSYALDTTPATGTATVTCENVNYLAANAAGVTAENSPLPQSFLKTTAATWFPATDYSPYLSDYLESIINWNLRATPKTIAPGMIGVNKNGFSSSTVNLTITGTNMDRVERVVIVPRGNLNSTMSSSPTSQEKLKNVVIYNSASFAAANPDRYTVGAIAGWERTKRNIKTQTTDKIVVEMLGSSLIRSDIAASIYSDSIINNPDYLDVYLLCGDEGTKQVDLNSYVSYTNPNLVRDHAPDFSLTLSDKASSGAVTVNTDAARMGGNYLAIVRSNFSNNKPASPRLTVSDSVTGSQYVYKALQLTGLNSEITRTTGTGGAVIWTMTVPDEVRVNEYLRIVPQVALAGVAYITVEERGNTITISSTNCKVMAGDGANGLTIFYDFISILDATASTYWYSNQFDKVDKNKIGSAGSKYDADTDVWESGAKLYGTGIAPSAMKKVLFLPKNAAALEGDVWFDAGLFSGGITGVYPYTDNVGLQLELRSFEFLPDFLKKLLDLESWDLALEEARYPYDLKTGDVPQISTGDGVALAIGGNFMIFEAGASVDLDINTLWEERNRFGFDANVNIFNKLKLNAQLLLNEYDGEMIPDKIYFSAASDAIGLVPPTPILQLSKVGGGINNIGKTFGHEGWNYLPPVSITVTVGGEIGIPHTEVDLGFDEANLTVAANGGSIEMNGVQIGPLYIADNLNLKLTGDFSPGVQIPGMGDFKLSMPIVEISGGGTLKLSFDNTEDEGAGTKIKIPNFASGKGRFTFRFDGGRALQAFFNSMNNAQKTAAGSSVATKLQEWSTSDKDMVVLMDILKEMGFDFTEILKSAVLDYLSALSISGNLSGSVYIPENVPVIGGWNVMQGEATFNQALNYMTVTAQGSLFGSGGPKGGIEMFWDMNKTFNGGLPKFSLMSAAALDPAPAAEATIAPTNLNIKTVKPPENSGGMRLLAFPGGNTTDGWQVTIEADDIGQSVVVSVDVPTKTDITLTPSTGTPITGLASNNDIWVELYDADGDGSIDDVAETSPYAYRALFELSAATMGAAGTVWTVTGTGITQVQSATVLPLEQVDSVTYTGTNTVGFTFSSPKQGVTYTADISLVSTDDFDNFDVDTPQSGGTIVASDKPVTAASNTIALDADVLAKLQSGSYRAVVTVYHNTTESGDTIKTPIASYGVSAAATYANPNTPAQPTIGSVNYIGDGASEIQLDTPVETIGYEVRIPDVSYVIDENGLPGAPTDLVLDYAPATERHLVIGPGLALPFNGNVYVRAYYIFTDGEGNTYKIFGQESASTPFTIAKPVPAIILVNTAEFSHQIGDDHTYYASLIVSDTPVPDTVTFTATCASYKLTISEEGRTVADGAGVALTDEADAALNYNWPVDLTKAARYTVIIETLTVAGDSGREVFQFIVDGTGPLFVADASEAVFDGTNLTFSGFLEEGATITAPTTGTWQYTITDAEERQAAGDYSGTWTGSAGAITPQNITLTPDDGSSAIVAQLYDIPLAARDFAGNETHLSMQLSASGSSTATGAQQLVLNTSAGNSLSVGMTGVTVLASTIVAPSYTEQSITIGALTNLTGDNPSVLTVDSGTGAISIVGVGTATITGTYGTLPMTKLTITVVDKLPLAVSVQDVTEDSVTLLLPALPGFTGTVTVTCGSETKTIVSGFDSPQTVVFSGLTKDTDYEISFTPDGTAYAAAGVYIRTTAQNVTPPPGKINPGSGAGTDENTVPAQDGTVQVAYTRSGNTATLSLPQSKIDELLDASDNQTVSINLSSVSGVNAVALSGQAARAFAQAGVAVELKLPNGSVRLDTDALSGVAAQAGNSNITVSVRQVASSSLNAAQRAALKDGDIVFEINVLVNGAVVHNFDGTITVTVPYSGALPVAVWYLNDAGELEKLVSTYNAAAGTVSFTVSHLSAFILRYDAEATMPFTDVSADAWYYDDVLYVWANGLFNGTGATTFSPNTPMTRGMIVTVLYRHAGSPDASSLTNPFSDVANDQYYTDAMKWAAENGIVLGIGDNKFAPNANITRQDFAVILNRYAAFAGLKLPEAKPYTPFNDDADIADYAKEAVEAFFKANIINGKDNGIFDPKGTATRAEVAAMLHRFLEAAE